MTVGMVKTDRFLISHKPYAIALASFKVSDRVSEVAVSVNIRAVWFRRRQGVTVACIGRIWDIMLVAKAPATALEFLDRVETAGYGANCHGRWDGRNYWGAEDQEVVAMEHLPVLRPMLAAYPAVPDGYDGWWEFRR